MKQPATPGGRVTSIAVLVVAIGFVCNFAARGVVDTFLVFMVPLKAEFGWRHADLTQVYSIYLVTLGLMSPLTGAILDRWGPRVCYAAGLVLIAAAIWVASQTSAIWHLFLAAGIMCGMASSFLGMVPASALIGRWFDRHMGVGVAIAYAGFGSGMLAVVPLAQVGIDSIGWRETYTVMFWSLLCLIPAMVLLPWTTIAAGAPGNPRSAHLRSRPGRSDTHGGGEWTVRAALGTAEFWLLVQAFFFTAVGSYLTTVQTIAFLIDRSYPPLLAAFAFGAAGMLSIFGVIFAGWSTSRFGIYRTTTVSFVGSIVGVLALLACSYWPHGGWVVLHILAFGSSQGARGPVISSLCARIFARGRVSSIYGLIFMIMAFGSGTGSFLSGWLRVWTGDYITAFAVAVVAFVLAMTPFTLTRRLTEAHELLPPAA